ncbi:MAG: tetratricopeptide repeat protein [Chitinivibrionia bacterium]|nr:tetratricopeptide repeat protein [Chitinivibrionia bacterium]
MARRLKDIGCGVCGGVSARRAVLAGVMVLSYWVLGACAAQKTGGSYVEDPVKAGNKALAEMRLEEAKALFEEAEARSYQVPKAKYGLAEVMVRSGLLKEAERYYREALEAQAEEGGKVYTEAHAGLGILLLDTERWEEGAAEIRTARRESGGYWPGVYGEARLLMRERKWEEAEKLLKEGSKRKGVSEGEDLYHRGWALFYLGSDLGEAEKEALSAFHLNPSNPVHGELVAEVYGKRNLPALAVSACEEVLGTPGITPSVAFIHFTGTLYQKVGRYNEARDFYLRAVSMDSTYTPVLKDLAGLLELAKQYDTAAQIYMRFLEQESGDVGAMVGLAGSLFEGGRYTQALAAAEKAMGVDSTLTSVRLAYARAAIRSRNRTVRDRGAQMFGEMPDTLHWQPKDRVLVATYELERGALEGARQQLEAALGADSSYAEAYFQRGLLAMKTGDGAGALADFETAIRHDARVPLYHLNIGVVHFQGKQYREAIGAFRRSIALDSKFVIGHTLLAQALIAVDSLGAAEAQYKVALGIDPKNGTALRGLGYCSLKRGDFQGAANAYKAATEADPKNADGWVGLGQAYLTLGNITGAAEALRQAETIDPGNASLKASWELLNRARRSAGG